MTDTFKRTLTNYYAASGVYAGRKARYIVRMSDDKRGPWSLTVTSGGVFDRYYFPTIDRAIETAIDLNEN